MKKILIIITIALILPLAYYLISPLFVVVELNEELPGTGPEIKDAMRFMDPAAKAEFQRQVDEMKDKVLVSEEEMPSGPNVLAEGDFKPRAHDVQGRALLLESDDGEKIVRFEDFETINGPDLYIYLSSELGDDDFIDLGKIKATKGNINYVIPAGVDTKKYNNVLVWCKAFGVLFSYSVLS